LESDQWRDGEKENINGLVAQVLRTFEHFDKRKSNFGFLTLQCSLDDILCTNGGNDYAIRHVGKARRLRKGTLQQMEASKPAIATAHFLLTVAGHLQKKLRLLVMESGTRWDRQCK
jgi:hypothetical protein